MERVGKLLSAPSSRYSSRSERFFKMERRFVGHGQLSLSSVCLRASNVESQRRITGLHTTDTKFIYRAALTILSPLITHHI